MRKINLKFIAGVLAALLALLIALHPSASANAAKGTLIMCGNILIPSLLPFFICSYILIYSGLAHKLGNALGHIMSPLFSVNGSGGIALACGLLSGYPTGAAVTAKLYTSGCINKNEAERLICFSNNCGPLFILGAIGNGIYQSRIVGIILLASHIAAAITVGIVFKFFGTPSAPLKKPTKENAPLLSAFSDATASILGLCGFVIFFAVVLSVLKATGFVSLITELLVKSGFDGATASLISQGVFEITTAVSSAKTTFLPAVSCVLAWGGASVLLQTASIAKSAGLSIKKYIPAKLLCGGISALYTKLLLCIFPVSLPVFNPASPAAEKTLAFVYYLLGSFTLAISVFAIFSFVAILIRGIKNTKTPH